jgi:hypothetical protein
VISLIINTCADRPDSNVLSHGGQPYKQRAFALQNFILPAAIADPDIDEVIVVGEWHDGEGYTYVPKPSIHFSSDDAPHQRQAAFEVAKGDWLVFQHDDHMLENRSYNWDSDFAKAVLRKLDEPCVVIPQRRTRLRNVAGERLPNGEPREDPYYPASMQPIGYISGHCAIYRREVLEQCPWANVPAIRTWDIAHTAQIREAGFNIHWSDSLRVWDVEAGSTPWR